MVQRFNAPPGWDVPPGFVPGEDWRPDPSWPDAPDGWAFWVEEPSASDAPTSSSGPYGAVSPYGTPPPYGTSPEDVSAPSPYGTPSSRAGSTPPVGAFGSAAAGHIGTTTHGAYHARARRSIMIGAVILVIGIGINVASWSSGDHTFRWWFIAIGAFSLIRGLVDLGKAKKMAAAATHYGSGVVRGPAGQTPPGVTPPGENPKW